LSRPGTSRLASGETDTDTVPVPARMSPTRSLERVRLAPGAIGCTVRRVSAPVPGWIATVKLWVSASTFGPRRVTSITAVPCPPAVTGMAMPLFALASSLTDDRSASAATRIGPRMSRSTV
jgi:hypothetical protein